MTHKIKAVLFDVNHTLIGIHNEDKVQEQAVHVLYNEVMRQSNAQITFDDFEREYKKAWKRGKLETLEEYKETRYESIVSRTLLEFGVSISDSELEDLLQVYMATLYESAYPIQGVKELLDGLTGQVRICAITNYKYASGMRGLLATTGILEYLDAIVISSEVGWKKPAPAIYEYAISLLDVEAKDCVVVGNEIEKDLWQAKEMGMVTVLFESEEHQYHDKEFAEVLTKRIGGPEAKFDHHVLSVPELQSSLSMIINQ